MRSSAVSATIENGVSWWTSRTVSPPPSPVSGCCASCGAWVAGLSLSSPGSPLIAHGSITTVAAIAVNSSDGAGRRHGTARCYVCVSCYQCFDTVVGPTKCHAGRPATAPQSPQAFLRCRLGAGPRRPDGIGQPGDCGRGCRERRGRCRDGRGSRGSCICCRGARRLDGRHDRRHQHTLEQVDGLAGTELIGGAGQVAEQPAAAAGGRGRRQRWITEDRVGARSGIQPDGRRDRHLARGGQGRRAGDRRSERRIGDRRRRGQAWKRRRTCGKRTDRAGERGRQRRIGQRRVGQRGGRRRQRCGTQAGRGQRRRSQPRCGQRDVPSPGVVNGASPGVVNASPACSSPSR